eukprot:TRINITY_DN8731_c0_g1_i1.p1 TRINITY_DN8731_c0_g1~~TRINITY_DN8731_c0_g1_i1.p1  ORF type:complete len:508 (-),score=133.68 TRINITY_DN8731_c0_g1_i1:118-1641(-)
MFVRDLGGNRLRNLPDRLFVGLAYVETLKFGHNKIETLPERIFQGLASLKNIYLEYNRLKSMPEESFEGLISLQRLEIQCNKLESLSEGLFEGLTNLNHVDLRDNKLESLPIGLFGDCPILTQQGVLQLDRNYWKGNVEDLFVKKPKRKFERWSDYVEQKDHESLRVELSSVESSISSREYLSGTEGVYLLSLAIAKEDVEASKIMLLNGCSVRIFDDAINLEQRSQLPEALEHFQKGLGNPPWDFEQLLLLEAQESGVFLAGLAGKFRVLSRMLLESFENIESFLNQANMYLPPLFSLNDVSDLKHEDTESSYKTTPFLQTIRNFGNAYGSRALQLKERGALAAKIFFEVTDCAIILNTHGAPTDVIKLLWYKGFVLNMLGKQEEATSLFEKIVVIGEKFNLEIDFCLAYSLGELGLLSQSISCADILLEKEPNNILVLAQKCSCLMSLGNQNRSNDMIFRKLQSLANEGNFLFQRLLSLEREFVVQVLARRKLLRNMGDPVGTFL